MSRKMVIRFFDIERTYYCGRNQDGSIRRSVEIRYANLYDEDSRRLVNEIIRIIEETGKLCNAYPAEGDENADGYDNDLY